MARFVFLVARHLPNVYEHLRTQFASEPNVTVMVDRRVGERRHGESSGRPAAEERRACDRRRNASADEDLRAMGYAFIRLD